MTHRSCSAGWFGSCLLTLLWQQVKVPDWLVEGWSYGTGSYGSCAPSAENVTLLFVTVAMNESRTFPYKDVTT